MRFRLASDVMRTTLDIDEPILRELKTQAKLEHKSLGRLASDLLAQALSAGKNPSLSKNVTKSWTAKPMNARVNLADSDALYSAMETEQQAATRVAEDTGEL